MNQPHDGITAIQDAGNWHGGKAAWPVLLGVAFILAGAALLGLATYLRLLAATENEDARKLALAMVELAPAAADRGQNELDWPPYAVHLSDLDTFLRAAPPHGVTLGSLAFRSEQVGKTTVTRHLEVQVDSGYEPLKRFIADVLLRLPNVFLEEIRIEQISESGSSGIRGSMKFGMAYRAEAPASLPGAQESPK